jgi:hypothetical protein
LFADHAVVGFGVDELLGRLRTEHFVQSLGEHAELELAEERHHLVAIEVLHAALVEVKIDWKVRVDGNQVEVSEGGFASV